MSTYHPDTNTAMAANDPMSRQECNDLVKLEMRIKAGLQIWHKVGEALAEIKDRRLYRANYASFKEYARDKWDISEQHAYRLIEGAEVVANVALDSRAREALSQRGAAELAGLPPGEQREVAGAIAGRGDPVTAPRVRQEVAARQLDGLGHNEKLRRVEDGDRRYRDRVADDEDKERVETIERLGRRCRKLHAGLVDRADECDVALDLYLHLVSGDRARAHEIATTLGISLAARMAA